MEIDEWWPRLDDSSRAWLSANNGDVVSPDVLADIERAGGVLTPGAPWLGEQSASGYVLSDAATDWIEAVANGETPTP